MCDWEGAVRVEGQALLGKRPEVLWIEVTDYLDFGKGTADYSDFGKVTADYSDFGKVTRNY